MSFLISSKVNPKAIFDEIFAIGKTLFEKALADKNIYLLELESKFGNKYKTKAEILGGVILILIGLKILLEYLIN